jgi:hypothetical protein
MGGTEPPRKPSSRLGSFNLFWPDVGTDKGVQDAIKGGAYAAGYLAASYALSIVLIMFAGHDAFGPIDDDDLMIGMVVVNSLLVLAGCVLTWFIWAKHSIVAAGVTLAWIVFEIAAKVITLSGGRGIVVVVFALIFAINGVRGTLAAKNSELRPPVEA